MPRIRPGVAEALLRVIAVTCLVVFADSFGDRWAFLAAFVGIFLLTTDRRL